MEEKDFIQELFADKLANAEAPVNPELWNAISSKISTGATASSGLSSLAKWLLGLGSAAAITTASLIYFNRDTEESTKANKQEVPQQQASTLEEQETSVSVAGEDRVETLPNESNQAASGGKENTEKATNESSRLNPHTVYVQPERRDDNRNNEQQAEKEVLPFVKPKEKEITTNDKQHPANTGQEQKTQLPSVEVGQLPNVFTPNNDSENDFLYISVKGLHDFVLTVLNEKNETVFRTTDPDFKWDGRDQHGNLLPAGNKYIYFFSGKDAQGNPVTRYNKLEIRY